LEALKDLKMNEQYGNINENKGSRSDNQGPSANVIENKAGYTQDAGMLLKTKAVIGNSEPDATSNRPSVLPVSDDGRMPRQAPGALEFCLSSCRPL
jgi:hypothetical protein